MEKTRIQKIIADSGYCSRRKAESLIAAGQVKCNGRPVKLGDKAGSRDLITVNGERIAIPKKKQKLYLMLNKPRGYVTTMSDELDRRCVMDLLEDVPERVYPVGRLDRNSEGLLLLTNDGDFANRLMHPSHEIEKCYRVLVSGFEHNAVMRPLYARNCQVRIAGRRLFCWEELLESFRRELRQGVDAAVFTHVSNVFGYILPVETMARLCREAGVPFILDAAQSAGCLPVDFGALGAEFIAMPGHKGLLGPQGTGLLLCAQPGTPLIFGGTGSQSRAKTMPEELPERLEAGTVNVPGAAGLAAGLELVERLGCENIFRRGHSQMRFCARGLEDMGFRVYAGPHQAMTVSFRGKEDCEELAEYLGARGIALRAGLHCAPLAHESAGTLEAGTVRFSLSAFNTEREIFETAKIMRKCLA